MVRPDPLAVRNGDLIMKFDCQNILQWTEAQLKYTYDVSLQEATPQELHEALGQAVMMAISDNWNHSKHTREHQRKAYYISAEYLIGRLVYSNLYNLGILDEMKQLFAERGVDLAILEDVEAGKVEFTADNEDIHMNIEAILTERIGAAGKRLHTGRSRNDQVAVDLRMYLRDECE